MIEYDMAIHKNPDASAWAKFFCEINPPEKTGLDEGLMIAWFANAMMAMHDHIMNTGPMNGDEAQYWIDREKK
jgi:hypothetical protein